MSNGSSKTSMFPTFIDALHFSGATPDRADKMRLYAWLIGNWEMDVVVHNDDGSKAKTKGSIHAGWVLEGRAIQDVFAVPGLFYGTSLRFYDPYIDAWQVFWIDPLKQVFFRMIGRSMRMRSSTKARKRQNSRELTAFPKIRKRGYAGFLAKSSRLRFTGAPSDRPMKKRGSYSGNILCAVYLFNSSVCPSHHKRIGHRLL